MSWETPILVDIACGMEVTAYVEAEEPPPEDEEF